MPLIFPIHSGTFPKSFQRGAGNVEISTDSDVWKTVVESNGLFSKAIAKLAKVNFSFTTPFQIGTPHGVGLGFSIDAHRAHFIQIIWPGEDDGTLAGYGVQNLLGGKKLYMRLVFSAKAGAGFDATVPGEFPVGALSTKFGIAAGGNVAYERLALYDQTTPAADIVKDVLAGVRLPQQVMQVSGIPAPGEVLVSRFGGYLNLSSEVSWGYKLSGLRALDTPSALNLDFAYQLRLMAGASIGYQLAGDFSLEARRGADKNFVRFVVRKSRDSEFNLAADFNMAADIELAGLPTTANQFLGGMLGADARAILSVIGAGRFSTVAGLETAAGKLTSTLIHEVAFKYLGAVLDNSNLARFVDVMHTVVDKYNNADQGILHLYQDSLSSFPEIPDVVNTLAELTSRNDLKKIDPNSKAWDLIRRLWSAKIYNLLTNDDEFAKFSNYIKTAKAFFDDPAGELKSLMSTVEAFNPFGNIFKTLGAIKTGRDLVTLGDKKLEALVEKLIGRPLDGTDLDDQIKKLQEVLRQIQKFNNTWYSKVKKAVHQSFQFSLHDEYSRATKNAELLDVEIDLSDLAGQALAASASCGDFEAVLKNYKSRLVKINQGVFTHKLTETARIQLNVLGWSGESVTQVIQNAEEAIQQQPGGLLHIYATSTSIEESRRRGNEKIHSNLIFRTVSEGKAAEGDTQQYVASVLKDAGVDYDLTEENTKLRTEQLSPYLEMAEYLKLIPSRDALMGDLKNQFGDTLGKVELNYAVRFDAVAVRRAFSLDRDTAQSAARHAMRKLIASAYIAKGAAREPFWGRIAFAYLSDAPAQIFYTQGPTALKSLRINVTLPSWYTRGASRKVALSLDEMQRLLFLYQLESDYSKRLGDLIDLIKGGQFSTEDLDNAAKAFIDKAAQIDEYRANTFFCMFDKIVREGGGGAGRSSALLMEITTPEGKIVTKCLMEPNTDTGAALAVESASAARA